MLRPEQFRTRYIIALVLIAVVATAQHALGPWFPGIAFAGVVGVWMGRNDWF